MYDAVGIFNYSEKAICIFQKYDNRPEPLDQSDSMRKGTIWQKAKEKIRLWYNQDSF
jgi:hypothetical protein